jgi:hypothetical protein
VGSPVLGTGSAITFAPQTLEGAYTVLATNTITSCVRNMSGAAVVSVTPVVVPAVSLSLSTDNTVCAGTPVMYTATAVNGGTSPTYTWAVNSVPVSAATSASYMFTPSNGDIITVSLTGSTACSVPAVVTAGVTMTVNANQTPLVSITADPAGTICKGASVTFAATPTFGGSAPVYSWMRNGVYAGAGPSFTVVPDDNDIVNCTMTSNYSCRTTTSATSTDIVLNVEEPPVPVVVVSTDAGPDGIKPGVPVTFTATVVNAGATPQMQWIVNGTEIAGATTFTFVSTMLEHLDTITCRVLASGACGGTYTYNSIVLYLNGVGVAGVPVTDMDIRILPNPSKGTFNIKGYMGTAASDDVQVQVTNMLGQVVYNKVATTKNGTINEQIVLDNTISNGMYLVNLISGNRSKVFHVTVSH